MSNNRQYVGNIRAPEFPAGLDWINTREPLTLSRLRGKFVLLDFWTYGCINCMHIIPDLRRLEETFSSELVVIGVHSAKFANEGDVANLRRIVQRYGIEHPVVNDKEFVIWRAYAVRAWPTTSLINPDGKVIASHSGEGVWQAYANILSLAIAEHQANGKIDHTPIERDVEAGPQTALMFPGKIEADEGADRLYIADSGHNRIVIATFAGQVIDVVGSGQPGLVDGDYAEAQFWNPQGMAVAQGMSYVADTDNHAIRVIDLADRSVSTLAGNGTKGYLSGIEALARAQLNSPWDLALFGDQIFVAMAGTHQIWRVDLKAGTIDAYAGSGREGLYDAKLPNAALAQPSGITTDGKRLYFADSEASAIRRADLASPGVVATIVGEGLFDFGDVDGPWPRARLQHPLGIAHHRGLLYVADTYNHKVKTVDPETDRAETFSGSGKAGQSDGVEASFYEPGGLTVAGETLLVADTNNHAIRSVDLGTRAVDTIALSDPKGLLAKLPAGGVGRRVRLDEQTVRAGASLLSIDVSLPAGYKVNPAAPSRVVLSTAGQGASIAQSVRETDLAKSALPTEVPIELGEGRHLILADLALYYCDARAESICLIHMAKLQIPVLAAKGEAATVVHVPVKVIATGPETGG